MTEKKIDFKKEEKKFYAPKRKPERIFVPEMNFLMVDGKGDPDGEAYQKAVQSLYAIAYTIKMSKMGETVWMVTRILLYRRWKVFGGLKRGLI